MKLSRRDLIRHLNRIHSSGLIKDAILREDLSCSALHKSGTFLVDAPGHQEDVFPEPVGVMSVDKVISALKKTESGGPEVDISFDPSTGRLLIEEEPHFISFQTESPETTGTRLGDTPSKSIELRDKFMEDFEENGIRYNIPEHVAEGFQDMHSLLSVDDDFEIEVGEEGAALIVGSETGSYDRIDWPNVQWPQEYRETYRADALNAALDRIDNYEDAQIIILGPDDSMAIQYEGYTYILSPME